MAGKEEEKMEVDTTIEKKKAVDPNVTPSASGDDTSKYPDMALAQEIHEVSMIVSGKLEIEEKKPGMVAKVQQVTQKLLGKESETEVSALMAKILSSEVENPSLYRHLAETVLKPNMEASELSFLAPETELAALDAKHQVAVKELEAKVEEAGENAGDMEVLAARFNVARFAAKALSQEAAVEAYDKILKLPKLSSGKTMDATMECARVASFYNDVAKTVELVESATKIAADGGDWDRRNRLKVYSALCKLLHRDVKGAAGLLIDCIATFSCTELCSYQDFIVYTMVANILHLPRTELKAKIVDGPEILAIREDVSVVYDLVCNLYNCDYKAFLHSMIEVHPVLMADRFLQPHAGYILRELHVLGYKQFLDSYKSVTLQSMADSFGVSSNFLDLQLSRFIAAGRLPAKIDKFGGVVETTRPDLKNAQYRDMIQKGDLLLNRIQKLARVVDL